jgi:DNA repair protein SbcC/Rad50
MEILSVSLRNFKIHGDREFLFQPGTNAICGENGAGKTSILEAIAWVLFNHCDYKNKDQLIKAGASSAQSVVTFVSNHDGRSYRVSRCTNKGYEVYDPQVKAKLPLTKVVDVSRWLRQHLGVSASTDLPKLFANTIGIPQGTFTSDFFKNPEERKQVFDPILKVEEYKQAFEKSVHLENYAKTQVRELEQQIESAQDQLAALPDLQQQFTEKQQALAQDQTRSQQLQQQLAELEIARDQYQAEAIALQDLEQQLQTLQTQIEVSTEQRSLISASLSQAQQSVNLCQTHQPSYQAYGSATAALQALEQRQRPLASLQQQRDSQQQKLHQLQLQLSQVQTRLLTLQESETQIEQLQPALAQQQALEQQIQAVMAELQQIAALQRQAEAIADQLKRQETEFAQRAKEIDRLQALLPLVEEIPAAEQKRDRLQQQLSRIQSAQQFAQELHQVVTDGKQRSDRYWQQSKGAIDDLRALATQFPVLAQAIKMLQQGRTLSTDLLWKIEQILNDLSQQVCLETLTENLEQVQSWLKTAYASQAAWATCDSKLAQSQQQQQQIQHLQIQLRQLQTETQAEAELQHQQSQIQTQLTALDDPRGKIRVLQLQIQSRPKLAADALRLQTQQTELEQAIALLDQQIFPLLNLSAEIADQKQRLQTHATGYQIYLQQERQAAQHPALTVQLQAAIATLTQLQQQREQVHKIWQHRHQNYDPRQLLAVTSRYEQTKTERDQLAGSLPVKQEQLHSLSQQLQSLQNLAQKCAQAQLDLNLRRQIKQLIGDARIIFKESGPRITQFYLSNISQAGDRLFRELLNRPDIRLEWTQDYEIRVQTAGHWRSFPSLSGGEQMCAALAVRLALLKVLSEIDIAFFDEPTTNMDQARRSQLAEALGNLKSFRQLFVISHDDTFENMTENIIRVVRVPD